MNKATIGGKVLFFDLEIVDKLEFIEYDSYYMNIIYIICFLYHTKNIKQ